MAVSPFSTSTPSIIHQLHSNGHDVRYIFTLHNLGALEQEWTFVKDYMTPCETSPTSWNFRMTFRRIPKSDGFSCHVLLKRNDSINITVNVLLGVTFCGRGNFSVDYPLGPMTERLLRPGGEKSVFIIDVLPHQFRYLLQDEIYVGGHILIRNCHVDSWNEMRFDIAGAEVESEQLLRSKI